MVTLSKNYLLILVLLFACTSQQDTSKSNENAIPNEVDVNYVYNEYVKSWQVLAQNSNLIAQNYYPDLLNSPINVNLYNKSFNQALNFGVYSVDLEYAINHDSYGNDTIWALLYALKDLSNDLGVNECIWAGVAKKPSCNLGQKGGLSLADYEAILIAIKNHLIEENRAYQAALILTGAWLETLYLASNIHHKLTVNPKSQSDIKIVESYILYQKEQLDNITLLLQLYGNTSRNKDKIKVLVHQLKSLQMAYNQANSEMKYQQIRNCVTDLRTSVVLNCL